MFSIKTASNISLELQVSEKTITESDSTCRTSREILMTVTDESGIIKELPKITASLTADEARTLAFVLRRISKERKQKKVKPKDK